MTAEYAEQALMCCLLLEPDLIDEVGITADDLFRQNHRDIFTAIQTLGADAADVNTVGEHLRQSGSGVTFADLAELLGVTASSAYAMTYAEQVREAATRRRLNMLALTMIHRLKENAHSQDVLGEVESTLQQIAAGREGRTAKLAADVALELLDRIHKDEPVSVVSTGFRLLNWMHGGGYKAGNLVILAARPSMGKSTLATQIAVNAATGPVLFCSLEMSAEDIVSAHIARAARVAHDDLTQGRLHREKWDEVGAAVSRLGQTQLFINDHPGQTPQQIRRAARALRRRHNGIRLVVVDYLQLLGADGKYDSRTREVGDAAREMKRLAGELQCPVLLLSQLSRSVESRQDKRPMLSDLRDSGEIEQHADVVTFIYRDGYYNPNSADRNVAEVIVAKQRLGRTGTIPLRWLDGGGFADLPEGDVKQWRDRQTSQ